MKFLSPRDGQGENIVNLLTFSKDEKISAIVAVKGFNPDQYLIFATAQGNVKTSLSAYNNPARAELSALV